MKILNDTQIRRKAKRIALEIAERHLKSELLYIGGINNNGMRFASLLIDQLEELNIIPTKTFQIRLAPADPTASEVEYDLDLAKLKGADIIIVDDVANTGRTLFYACKPLMNIIPGTLEIAVMVDRKHKSFPIKVDYVGLSLATTLMDNIDIQFKETGEFAAYLQ
jgi:pyrimidine operon attenuation protein/uracil phosphoribosyltransferase